MSVLERANAADALGHRMVDTPDGFIVCERCGEPLATATTIRCEVAQ